MTPCRLGLCGSAWRKKGAAGAGGGKPLRGATQELCANRARCKCSELRGAKRGIVHECNRTLQRRSPAVPPSTMRARDGAVSPSAMRARDGAVPQAPRGCHCGGVQSRGATAEREVLGASAARVGAARGGAERVRVRARTDARIPARPVLDVHAPRFTTVGGHRAVRAVALGRERRGPRGLLGGRSVGRRRLATGEPDEPQRDHHEADGLARWLGHRSRLARRGPRAKVAGRPRA